VEHQQGLRVTSDLRPDVLAFGETMALVHGTAPGALRHSALLRLSCAGAESTVAIGLARLGHHATWVGRVGADELGALVRDTLRGTGVDVHAIPDPTRPTGLLLRSLRTPSATRVAYYRAGSAGAMLAADDVQPILAARPRIVHTSGITPALSAQARDAVVRSMERAHRDGSLVSYDINFRARLTTVADAADVLRDLVPSIDILFFGEDELPVVFAALDIADGNLETLFRNRHVQQLVLKRGRHGATAIQDGRQTTVPAIETVSVDPVGAGDSFVAGYLSGILDGLDVGNRLTRGAELGAFSVAACGDWEGLPTRDELGLIHAAPDYAER
jgi:2-dehydro-3-deoxygluconokinase